MMHVLVSLNFYAGEQFSLFPDIFQTMLSLRVLNHQIVQEFKVNPVKRSYFQMCIVYFKIQNWNTSNQGIQRSGTLRETHDSVMFFSAFKRCYIFLTYVSRSFGNRIHILWFRLRFYPIIFFTFFLFVYSLRQHI